MQVLLFGRLVIRTRCGDDCSCHHWMTQVCGRLEWRQVPWFTPWRFCIDITAAWLGAWCCVQLHAQSYWSRVHRSSSQYSLSISTWLHPWYDIRGSLQLSASEPSLQWTRRRVSESRVNLVPSMWCLPYFKSRNRSYTQHGEAGFISNMVNIRET